MIAKLIDVWNLETFDEELTSKLQANAELIRNYLMIDRSEAFDRHITTNPYGMDYIEFMEEVGRDMQARTIRAWHYTRLTDAEVDIIRRDGIYLSTLETFRRRLDAQVAARVFSVEVADALFAASPFHAQLDVRSNKFCMTSHPVATDDMTLLLGNWGGESAYFWLKDPTLSELVASIGVPRVLEIAVPLDATPHASRAGQDVLATFERTLGYKPDVEAFDLYSIRALGPEAVIAVHSEGERDFAMLAKGYPAAFPTRIRL
jgi:hypothetical protein